MSTDLREELQALARTQTFTPDPAAWERGRRARRRTRVLAVAAALVVLASATGLAFTLGPDREARTASTDEVGRGAIPHRIDDIPDDLALTTDLAVGRASTAFISATDDPVVITATDGVPHRLALDAWDPASIGLTISPDGTRLAYQQATTDDTRVGVLDLETGRTTSLAVHSGDELRLDGLTWSPDGTRIAWVASAVADLPAYVGQVLASGQVSQQVAPPRNVVSVAVANDGTGAIGRVSGGLFLWDPDGELEPVKPGPPVGAGSFSPDGRHLALGSAPDTASYTLDVGSGTVLRHPFPDGTLGRAVARPLGWMDDRVEVLLVQELAGDRGELVVTTPEVDPTSTWRGSVGSVDSRIASSVTLAVDLLPDLDGTSSQELTHDFGSGTDGDGPPTPFGIELSLFIGLGVAAAIALLMALRWLWRRFLS